MAHIGTLLNKIDLETREDLKLYGFEAVMSKFISVSACKRNIDYLNADYLQNSTLIWFGILSNVCADPSEQFDNISPVPDTAPVLTNKQPKAFNRVKGTLLVDSEEAREFCEQHDVKIQSNNRVDANSFLSHISRKRAHKHYSKDRLSRPRSAETTSVCLVNQPIINLQATDQYRHKAWYWINDNDTLKLAYLIQALQSKKTTVVSAKKGEREKM